MNLFLACVLLVATADAARILAVLPNPGRSHHIFCEAILKTLARAGHEVFHYCPFHNDEPVKNYSSIYMKIKPIESGMTKEELEMFMNMSPVGQASLLWHALPYIVDETFNDEKFQELLSSDVKFDVVITEGLFAQEPLIGLGHRFNCPVIVIQPFGAFSLINKAAGNPLSLAFIPDYAFPLNEHMSVYDRFLSSYSILSSLFKFYAQYLPERDQYMRTAFKDPSMPQLEDMIHNVSLFVNNVNPNVHYSQPYTPNIIPVGGIHVERKSTPLPPDMQQFLDGAERGVIYFSLGSILPDDILGPEFFEKFANAFRRLPQRVLWKTKFKMPVVPDNVKILRWAPQNEILAHSNVVLFMTHGGLLSQHEAIHAGVPVICTPFWGDQPMNAVFYETRGIGLKLLYSNLSEETIYSTITTVINNPKYRENAQRLSRIYRDSPQPPAQRLVYWVEYVLRHRGAPHIRPVSSDLSWYQLILLDVVAAVITVVITVAFIISYVIRKVLSVLCGSANFKDGNRIKKNL